MEELKNVRDKMDHLESEKLMLIVRNYQQYNYSREIRDYALTILGQRGITVEDLKLTGNFENNQREKAKEIFQSFNLNATIALFAYLLLLASRLVPSATLIAYGLLGLPYNIVSVILLILFAVCLFRSFMNQSDFYKVVSEDYGDGALLYLLLGFPFYIVMYFIFRRQMAEKMATFI